jgi:hypothetical protein
MRTFTYSYGKESPGSQRRDGRHNPATSIRWKHRNKLYRAVLPCGDSDEWEVFRDGNELFVVSRNTGLGYCGLSRFDYNPGGEPDTAIGSKRITVVEDAENVFFQDGREAFESDKWEEWTLRTLANRLREWM